VLIERNSNHTLYIILQCVKSNLTKKDESMIVILRQVFAS